MPMPTFVLRENDKISGFTVLCAVAVEQARSIAYELVHDATGARLLHLHNFDAENLFSITFPTPPPDDTGVPHILEHSVLGGSEKFEVKDPFFAIVKSSMATFINAMTGSDYTVYPVASNVKRDFFNLADVYWDAVFHPTLSRQTFAREGHHYELADPKDPSSDLIIKGIVYNEMKGSRSSPDSKVYDWIEKSLWPDTPYGKDSGGDPDTIPQLTYEQFRKFHQTHYHPSNAYIFLYGDTPTCEHLEFVSNRLDRFKRQHVAIQLPQQPRWNAPKSRKEHYPVGPNDPTTEKTFITMSWLLGSAVDEPDVLALAALDRILLGNQGAPLRKALVESRLGQDVSHSGFWAHGKESSFHVGLKGSEPDRTGAVDSLILQTLASIARQGVTREQADAAFQQLAYHYLEIGSQYPLALMSRVVHFWMHGQDPLTPLRARHEIEAIRHRYEADPRLFSKLIEQRLLNNPHRLTLTAIPEPNLQSRRDAEFAGAMARQKSAMTRSQIDQVVEQQLELERLLSAPSSPEALAALPILKVRDLPKAPREIPTTIEKLPGVDLLNNDVYANGVNYLQIGFDLHRLPVDLQAYIPLYASCVSKMGAGQLDYAATAQRVATFTGGVGFSMAASTRVDQPQSLWNGHFATKFLDQNAEHAFDVLFDLIFNLNFDDRSRLTDVLHQLQAHHRSRPAHDGMAIALRRAGSTRSREGWLNEQWLGATQSRLIDQLPDKPVQQTIDQLQAISAHLKAAGRLVASFTGTDDVLNRLKNRLVTWKNDASGSALNPSKQPDAQETATVDGLAAPMNVAYCVANLPAVHMSHPDGPLLQVASRLLSFDYVLEEVRFKGTAYGGGCGYDGRLSQFNFHSYRDPWIWRTLDVYREALNYVRGVEWTQADIDRAIIGTAKEFEHPIRPGEATGNALWRYLSGDTAQRRAARHAAMLAAKAREVKSAILGLLERGWPAARLCVVSSREKLRQASSERPDAPIAISDILPGKEL